MKVFTVFLTSLFVIFGLAGQPSAETQITSTGTNYGSSTMKISPIDNGIWVGTAEQMGIRVDDTGEGPFHMMSTDIQLILYGDKTGVHYRGYETHVDKDGDKVLWEIWDFPAGTRTGKGKIIGGTGKFEGIEGTMDFVLQTPPKGFPEGTSRTVCKETKNVTLKNPK
jgi:hypothetical protein